MTTPNSLHKIFKWKNGREKQNMKKLMRNFQINKNLNLCFENPKK